MKPALIISFLLTVAFCNAQNYQCLQYGKKNYFINDIGYLRGIRIDSVVQTGDTTIYYPFHSLRGNYSNPNNLLDSNGGSWLGKKVLQLSNGTYIFDDEWGDSIIIKTQANIGDSWVFYKDSGNVHYVAKLFAIDTMTVLGVLDSVKKIVITAHDSVGIITSDPLDSFQIILSKNNGFVHVFDLYTFPYRLPGGIYTAGMDFFLDKSTVQPTHVYSLSGSPPNKSLTIFKITSLINPNNQQLYNWNISDIYEYQVCHVWDNQSCYGFYHYIFDSITNKYSQSADVKYHFTGAVGIPISNFFNDSSGTYIATFNTSYLLDTTLIPEEFHQQQLYYYYPTDSSFCMPSASYEIVPTNIGGIHAPYYFEGPVIESTYKIGLGQVHYMASHAASSYLDIVSSDLVFYRDSNFSCGYFHPLNILNGEKLNKIHVYPNPVNDMLNVDNVNVATSYIIYDIIGSSAKKGIFQMGNNTISMNSLAPGIYFLELIIDNEQKSIFKIIKN